ncbi:MAG: SGNH/GDSL hydrolase family protein, partial [Caulobacterales bacterium]|nr:SGNH/GDSL hydrolase family protein [Caulobacterales bacterium]
MLDARVVSVAALCAALSGPASAQESFFSNLVVFGDSLSDPGNIPTTLDAPFAYPPAPYSDSRFSNGDVWAQVLPELLTFDSVTNFAHGGAFSGQKPTPSADLVPLLGETVGNLNSFNTDILPPVSSVEGILALDETDMLSQLGGYLATQPTIGEDDLFSIWISANDYFLSGSAISTALGAGAITTDDVPAIVEAEITDAITNIATAVQTLDAAGARQIMVFNLPSLATTPSALSDPTGATSALFGNFSSNHNAALADTLGTLASISDATLYLVDVESLTNDAIANPGKYGLTNVTDACIEVVACVTDPSVQAEYLFWDGVHPTANSHAFTAAFAAD